MSLTPAESGQPYWHITDDPQFTIDPTRVPADLAAGDDGERSPGLMVTQDPHYWAGIFHSHPDELGVEYENANPRQYAAEIDLSGVPADQHWLSGRGYGDERWVNRPDLARVKRVIPLTQALAKTASTSTIPPTPGSAPIPAGNIRLWHYTGATPEQIYQGGLQMGRAKGEQYGEPNQVWASAKPPSFDNHNVVEFSVPRDDPRWDIGKYQPYINYASPEGDSRTDPNFDYGQYLHHRGAHVTFHGDIRPEEIHAVHEPWHQHYRYLMDQYPTPDAPKLAEMGGPTAFDWAMRDDPEALGRGVQAWKDALWPGTTSKTADAEREDPIYYHGTSRGPEDEDWSHIEPGRGRNYSETDPGYAYATTDRSAAEWYAKQVHDQQAFSWSRPVVYQVRPTGPVEKDPSYRGEYSRGNFAGDVRSQHPFEITDEHELPGDWHCEHCGSIDHETAECSEASRYSAAEPTWYHGTHADRAQAIQASGWEPNEDLWFSSSPQEAATYQERHGMGQPGAVLQAGLNYRNPFVIDRTTPEPHTTGFSPRLRQALQGAGVDPPDRYDWATELRNKGYDAIEYRKPDFTDVQLWDPALVSNLQPHTGVISSVTGHKLGAASLYKRWVFSPASGQVTINDNSGDPLDVKYHGDLARELNEPNAQHGFAYRIGNGWRLTDWEHTPLDDNFIVAQVMRALANEPGTPHEGSWTPLGADDWARPHHGLPT